MHVGAEVVIVGWAALEDVIIWLLLSNKAIPQEVKRDYRQFFLIVDGPGFGAMLVIFLSLLLSPDGHSSTLAAFGSGAAAMDLLLIQISFAGLFLFEGGLQEVVRERVDKS